MPAETTETPPASRPLADDAEIPQSPALQRNLLVLAAHQIVVRAGWIFKTESVIMPAVLDALGGGGWLRGCLPLLNRVGHSIPPLIMARRLKLLANKKWALAGFTLMMSASFLAVALVWSIRESLSPTWVAISFLTMYVLFFASNGLSLLTYNTLQGKLVPPTRRGRLLLVSHVAGAVVAISLALALMPLWITDQHADYAMILGFAGACFGVAGLVAMMLNEPRDHYDEPAQPIRRQLIDSMNCLRYDANFRRLAVIAAMFGSSLVLFPHYQALARGDRLQQGLRSLMLWVVVQNAGTALYSFIAGPVADRSGNRRVLLLLMPGIALAPLLALALAFVGGAAGNWFSMVFVLVGLTPVTMKTVFNYTLEIVPQADHPRYLSTLSLCMAIPVFCSPIVGWVIDRVGFDPIFLAMVVIVAIAWWLSFGLEEPRHRNPSADAGPVDEALE